MGRRARALAAMVLMLGGASALAQMRQQAPPSAVTVERDAPALVDRVRDALTSGGVQLDGLQVQTAHGMVTLRGQVTRLLDLERADTLVAPVRGVRGVVNLLTLAPPEISDATLELQAMQALHGSAAADGNVVEAEVQAGVVELVGRVASWPQRELAETLVKQVPGVRGVHNALRVEVRPHRADAQIAREVAAVLRWAPRLQDVSARVDGNVVTLLGTVASQFDKDQALMAARTANVFSVDADALTIHPPPPDGRAPRDRQGAQREAEIERGIMDQWRADQRVAAHRIRVDVDRGVAVLSGVTDTLLARTTAEEHARLTAGVVHVDNRIIVRPGEVLDDATLQARVRGALRADARLPRGALQAQVHAGVVRLTGQVESHERRRHAAEITLGQRGVVGVDNDLRVVPTADPGTLPPDVTLREDIESRLRWSLKVDADGVQVRVRNGVVSLIGTVATPEQKRAAGRAAREAGARAVDNRLQVRAGAG